MSIRKMTTMNTLSNQVSLVKVKRNTEHAGILYELLKQREHKISHKSLPSFDEHTNFVITHPYRIWFLIKEAEGYVGSIYAYKNNGIGISVNRDKAHFIAPAIRLFLEKNKPLKPIKSVRSAEFGVYAAPTDKELISVLKSLGAHLAQVTYLFV
jgi:hypothetical protein